MLVWAKNQARATLSTHETTRRIAELATDVVTGAVEYVPYADGPARFFKEQAHDVLQAPYASLQQSRSESENLVTRLREQLSSCEDELFEARREIKSLKSVPSVHWADESSTGILTPSTPLSAVASEQDLGAVRLRSGERALHETLKTRDEDIRNRIASLETQSHERALELQQQELKLHQINEQIEQRRKQEKEELADAEALRVRLASAEEQVRVLEDLLSRALAATDSRKTTPIPPGFNHGLQTPPATATDNDLTNSLLYAEPVLQRTPSTPGPVQSSRDLPLLVDEPPPPQLGTSLDYLPGTVDVHGQHFTTFSAVDDLEAVAPSPHWMPGHWGGESTVDVSLLEPDRASIVAGEALLVGVEPHGEVTHGFEGPIEHDLGVGIQLHHSLELPKDTVKEAKVAEEATATEEVKATEEAKVEEVYTPKGEKVAEEAKVEEVKVDEVYEPEGDEASEEMKAGEMEVPERVTVTAGTGVAEDEQDEARRLRPQSIRSVHSVLGTDIAESPERFSFHRSATDAAADVDEGDEEGKEDAVIPSPIITPAQDEALPAVERTDQDDKESAIDTVEVIAPAGTSARSDSPIPTPVAAVTPAVDSPVIKEAGPTLPTQVMPPSPGYFVAPHHLFNDEPKIFPPSPTSSTSEDPTTRPRAVSVTSAGIQPAIAEAEAEAEPKAAIDADADADTDTKADVAVPIIDAKPTTAEVLPDVVAHPTPASADVAAPTGHIHSASISSNSTTERRDHSRTPSPSKSQTRAASPLQRTPQKRRTSTTFELLRAIHGTPAAHEIFGSSPLSAGEKGKNTSEEHVDIDEAAGRAVSVAGSRKTSGTHLPGKDSEHKEGEDGDHSPRGRALSKAGRPKTKAGRISDMVEPVLHVLGLDEKDKERSRERSPTRQVSVTHERARSDTPAGSLGHKERPHSRVLSVFGVGSGSRRVSSSDGAELGATQDDIHSGDVSLEIPASGSDAKIRRGSRRSLVSRFSSIRDTKSRKDRD